jgi:hypothetical protein
VCACNSFSLFLTISLSLFLCLSLFISFSVSLAVSLTVFLSLSLSDWRTGCAHPLHQREERKREIEKEREREIKRERERERERERCRIFLKGMIGALAPLSFLVLKRMTFMPPSIHDHILKNNYWN